MKIASILLILGLLIASINGAQAVIMTKFKSKTELLLTYSGEDLEKYYALNDSIESSGSNIKSKCFEIRVTDEFGAPKLERRCAIILKNGDNIELSSQGNILRFKENELTSVLRENLYNNVRSLGKISLYKKRRRCTITNANPNCHDVIVPVITYVSLLKASGNKAGDFFCIDRQYTEKNLTVLKGCYLIPSKIGDIRGLNLKLEKLSCNKRIEGEFVAFLKAGQTTTNHYQGLYRVKNRNHEFSAIGYEPEREADSLDLYNFRLASYEFYGKGLKDGDISCQLENSTGPLSVFFSVTCTNHSKTDRFIGKAYRDGSALTIKACNYLKH